MLNDGMKRLGSWEAGKLGGGEAGKCGGSTARSKGKGKRKKKRNDKCQISNDKSMSNAKYFGCQQSATRVQPKEEFGS